MWAGILYAGGTIITTAILSAMQEISDHKINRQSHLTPHFEAEPQSENDIDKSTSSEERRGSLCDKWEKNYTHWSIVNKLGNSVTKSKDFKTKLENILNHPTENAYKKEISYIAKEIITSITNIHDPNEVPDDIQIIALKELLLIKITYKKLISAATLLEYCKFETYNESLVSGYEQYYTSQLEHYRQVNQDGLPSETECTPFQDLRAINELFDTAHQYLTNKSDNSIHVSYTTIE